jgi:hypothetical protein
MKCRFFLITFYRTKQSSGLIAADLQRYTPNFVRLDRVIKNRLY